MSTHIENLNFASNCLLDEENIADIISNAELLFYDENEDNSTKTVENNEGERIVLYSTPECSSVLPEDDRSVEFTTVSLFQDSLDNTDILMKTIDTVQENTDIRVDPDYTPSETDLSHSDLDENTEEDFSIEKEKTA